jgi:hypothetical protein
MIALSNSVHLYVRPEARDRLLELFGGVLGLQVVKITKAYVKSPEPMYAVRFPNGASISVEFTANALSEEQAARGAWLELRSDDAEGVQRKALGFGLMQITHPFTPFFYVQVPGGQVFRICSTDAEQEPRFPHSSDLTKYRETL